MISRQPGINTSVEITNISQYGFWLFYKQQEYFVPFDQFPWFKDATIKMIHHVEVPAPDHFHWPDLDVDLHVKMLNAPEKFLLVSKG